MKVIITAHARKRLQDLRQEQIEEDDIYTAARSIPGYIPTATRFRGFVASKGRPFDLVVKDVLAGRLVITIIGK
ncbi:hypothetical protein [Moorella sp. Hama-1]|uniref:hypothetical protein n=1 Tax=Moorella sp. Hama-1 TaxID=2138101 RepID=UPI000D6566FE|nr:hypothetical protein [Moorella sp. Hama-1]MDN5361611.1 hypothetical protein [Moorella sp. (in: firmicutes)]BCV21139.1 hypothetical protein hamaS1_12080 [Moorella sp. Hama-1]